MAAEHRLYGAEDIIVWTVLELLADPNDLPTKDRLDSNVKKTIPMVLRKVMYNVFPNMTMKYINALHYAYKRKINHQLLAVFIDDYFARKELTRFAPIPIFYRDNGGEVEWINIEGVNMGETAGGRKGSSLENGGTINQRGIDLEWCNTESVIDVDGGVDTGNVLMDIFTESGVDTDKWVDAKEELLNVLENGGVVMDEKVDAEDKLLGILENDRVDMNEEVDVEDVQMDIFKNS
ncbi:hypothetical protein QYM36_002787 [Artemia franciscana]|uniref:Uncharacterized protein n=1 Tax=Artemia franciscana TaxID=6661 RepID=A0AA88LF53_ARTSF|nr:hypothetical protein QYM36_002787 [Artemia franciscana]